LAQFDGIIAVVGSGAKRKDAGPGLQLRVALDPSAKRNRPRNGARAKDVKIVVAIKANGWGAPKHARQRLGVVNVCGLWGDGPPVVANVGGQVVHHQEMAQQANAVHAVPGVAHVLHNLLVLREQAQAQVRMNLAPLPRPDGRGERGSV
jgi:hypothetical protein